MTEERIPFEVSDGNCYEISKPRGTPYELKKAQQLRSLSRKPTLILIGDSLASRWPAILVQHLFKLPLLNCGIGGATIENTTWMVEQLQEGRDCEDVVVVWVGSANVKSDTVQEFERKREVLGDRLTDRLPNSRKILLNIPPKGEQGKAFDRKIQSLNTVLARCSGPSATPVDVHSSIYSAILSGHYASLYESDNVHLSATAYGLVTLLLANVI